MDMGRGKVQDPRCQRTQVVTDEVWAEKGLRGQEALWGGPHKRSGEQDTAGEVGGWMEGKGSGGL